VDLSPRLRALAAHVLPGRPMADVGTDHALLPAALLAAGWVPCAIGLDKRAGPLRQAALSAARAGPALSLRQGDGLLPLHPGEVDTIVVAGMGGALVADILLAGRAVVAPAARLVLQPNLAAERVRDAVEALGWQLVHEEWVEDRGRLYPVLVAAPGAAPPLSPLDRLQGPFLRRAGGSHHAAWLAAERARLRDALDAARAGGATEASLALERRLALLWPAEEPAGPLAPAPGPLCGGGSSA
jgi:tRNA (adenine22-N1)-methyltransferase